MGAPGASHAQMTALAERYENTAGSSLIYTVGGLATLAGTLLLAVALWRTHVVPRWTSASIPVAVVANVGGFSAASSPLLVASYVLLLAAFGRIALIISRGDRTDPPIGGHPYIRSGTFLAPGKSVTPSHAGRHGFARFGYAVVSTRLGFVLRLVDEVVGLGLRRVDLR
jgi:hypothetical protein